MQAKYTFYRIAKVSNLKLSKLIGIPISIVRIEIPKSNYFFKSTIFLNVVTTLHCTVNQSYGSGLI
jgi:hypothetical protein